MLSTRDAFSGAVVELLGFFPFHSHCHNHLLAFGWATVRGCLLVTVVLPACYTGHSSRHETTKKDQNVYLVSFLMNLSSGNLSIGTPLACIGVSQQRIDVLAAASVSFAPALCLLPQCSVQLPKRTDGELFVLRRKIDSAGVCGGINEQTNMDTQVWFGITNWEILWKYIAVVVEVSNIGSLILFWQQVLHASGVSGCICDAGVEKKFRWRSILWMCLKGWADNLKSRWIHWLQDF